MNKAEIEEIKNIFDSIICLAVEGAELFSATKIINSIYKEAEKGYNLVSCHLTPAEDGQVKLSEICQDCIDEFGHPENCIGCDYAPAT